MRNLKIKVFFLTTSILLSSCGGNSTRLIDIPTPIEPTPTPIEPTPIPIEPTPTPINPLSPAPLRPIAVKKNVSFFIVAHPDDTELFMGKESYHQIADSSKDKKIFIVLSAGDGNQKNTKQDKNVTWWEAREQAHTLAISFWNDFKEEPLSNEVSINNKYLQKISIGSNIVLYNFRFLDYDPTTSLDDLIKAKSNSLPDLKYNQNYSIEDIKKSLQEIIRLESTKESIININMTDEDPMRNPWDHKDHYATAVLANDIYSSISNPCKNLTKYLAYGFKKSPINLEGQDKERSFKLWSLMGDKLASYGYKRNDDPVHMTLVGKQYKSLEIQSSCKNI